MHKTKLGEYIVGDSFKLAKSYIGKKYKNKIQLILTSPPYPLNSPREYGNFKGKKYIDFFVSLGRRFQDLLTDNGSLVIELGNTWEHKRPMQSPIHMECALGLLKSKDNDLNLVQEFICHNPAGLPRPVPWTSKRRIRFSDSYTHLWWFSKTDYPKADNKKVLRPYGKAMKKTLKDNKIRPKKRPSGYAITGKSMLKDHGGSIMPNFIELSKSYDTTELRLPESSMKFSCSDSKSFFFKECRARGIHVHPARMEQRLAAMFIEFLTDKNDIVYDPFGGSNTTGYCSDQLERRWVTSEKKKEYEVQSIIRLLDPSLNNTVRSIK